MKKSTRREFFAAFISKLGALAVILAMPTRALAYLWETWVVRCPNCAKEDTVTRGTEQHICERCGKQTFHGPGNRVVTVVCPKGHPNEVDTSGRIESVKCASDKCGHAECRRDTEPPPPPRPTTRPSDKFDHH